MKIMRFLLIYAISFLFMASLATAKTKKVDLPNLTPMKPILGKDLTGWKVPAGNEKVGWYRVKDGVLEIRSGPRK